MSNSKKLIIRILVAIIPLITLLLVFTPFLKMYLNDGNKAYIFGYQILFALTFYYHDGGITYDIAFNFNIVFFIYYLLLILCAVASIVLNRNNLNKYIALSLSFALGIMSFLLSLSVSFFTPMLDFSNVSVVAGPYLSGVLLLINGSLILMYTLLYKEKEKK